MTFEEYQEQAFSTMVDGHHYGDISAKLMAQVLGLIGENGEFAEKIKKIIRDKEGKLSDEDKKELIKELGDILWYVSSVATLLGGTLSETAQTNLEKVLSRKERGVSRGSGDNR